MSSVSSFREVLLFVFRVGNLRFAAPQPPLKFDGVRQATSYGAACTQSGFGDLPGVPPGDTPGDIPDIPGGFPPLPTVQSEDCKSPYYPPLHADLILLIPGLFLNVVKPASIAQGVKLPVLFVSVSTCARQHTQLKCHNVSGCMEVRH